jgi:hypothetical protein
MKDKLLTETRKLKRLHKNEIISILNSDNDVPLNQIEDYWLTFIGLCFKSNVIVKTGNKVAQFYIIDNDMNFDTIVIDVEKGISCLVFDTVKKQIIQESTTCSLELFKYFSVEEIQHFAKVLGITLDNQTDNNRKLKKKTKNELIHEICSFQKI